MNNLLERYKEELRKLEDSGNLRSLKKISDKDFKVNLSSNDYLGVRKKIFQGLREMLLDPVHHDC
jgi:hypothetical protein